MIEFRILEESIIHSVDVVVKKTKPIFEDKTYKVIYVGNFPDDDLHKFYVIPKIGVNINKVFPIPFDIEYLEDTYLIDFKVVNEVLTMVLLDHDGVVCDHMLEVVKIGLNGLAIFVDQKLTQTTGGVPKELKLEEIDSMVHVKIDNIKFNLDNWFINKQFSNKM